MGKSDEESSRSRKQLVGSSSGVSYTFNTSVHQI